MMYSDYFALSSCAISVVFIPFMVVCLLRYGLMLQEFNYQNRMYLAWLGCAFAAAWAPLIAVSALALLWQLVLRTYLTHTAATELLIILGYAGLMLVGIAAVSVGFGRFCRVLGGAGWTVPRIDDRRLTQLFIISSLVVGALMLLLNIMSWQQWIYFVPIVTPLLIPFANLFFRPFPGRVVVGVGAEEPLGFMPEDATRIEAEPAEPDDRPELRQESVSQDTRLYQRQALTGTLPDPEISAETEGKVEMLPTAREQTVEVLPVERDEQSGR